MCSAFYNVVQTMRAADGTGGHIQVLRRQPQCHGKIMPSNQQMNIVLSTLLDGATVSGNEHAFVCQLWQHAHDGIATWPGEYEHRETGRVRDDFRGGEEENCQGSKARNSAYVPAFSSTLFIQVAMRHYSSHDKQPYTDESDNIVPL